jgi:hypothetical protein
MSLMKFLSRSKATIQRSANYVEQIELDSIDQWQNVSVILVWNPTAEDQASDRAYSSNCHTIFQVSV